MADKKVNAGEVIFNEGDVADFGYAVTSGSVELSYLHNGSEIKLGIVETGKVFGELAVFIPEELRPYTARALADCTISAMNAEEFEKLFYECPKKLQPFLYAACDKVTPTRSKTKVLAASLSKNDIGKVVISPNSDNLKAQMKQIEISVSSLPFRIGGYPEDSKKNPRDQVHLAIASLKNPLQISRQHCEIALDEKDNLVFNDLGSRFGSTVNGIAIGRGRGIYSAPLKKGNNEIFLGSDDSKYKLIVSFK